MTTLRLIDPNGYTVPGSVITASDGAIDETRAYLTGTLAAQHAADWADFGYDPRNYTIQDS
ncbi:hypothetical protein [Streptomyces sp. NPDC006551]|uniref:hypothetical protein n=1 Tax=Streptomyces sp. NPDC006551 TaxID=3157178 RepID=UPI0033BEFA97